MCPVYKCTRCRDTGYIRVYPNHARNIEALKVIICPASRCQMARILRLKEQLRKKGERNVDAD